MNYKYCSNMSNFKMNINGRSVQLTLCIVEVAHSGRCLLHSLCIVDVAYSGRSVL